MPYWPFNYELVNGLIHWWSSLMNKSLLNKATGLGQNLQYTSFMRGHFIQTKTRTNNFFPFLSLWKTKGKVCISNFKTIKSSIITYYLWFFSIIIIIVISGNLYTSSLVKIGTSGSVNLYFFLLLKSNILHLQQKKNHILSWKSDFKVLSVERSAQDFLLLDKILCDICRECTNAVLSLDVMLRGIFFPPSPFPFANVSCLLRICILRRQQTSN
jgi:hypothetical protein